MEVIVAGVGGDGGVGELTRPIPQNLLSKRFITTP